MAKRQAPPARRRITHLRAWREWAGMNLADVADAIPLNEGYLSQIETGVKRYNQDTLEGYARVLNIPPGWLLDRSPPPKGEDFDRADPQFLEFRLSRLDSTDANRRVAALLLSYETEAN
jgi:transcriptional regulator with XRE-family HTH domain